MELQLNPLKIDVVLEVLFRYCNKEHLKTFRLVNKQWRKISLPRWLEHEPQIRIWGDTSSASVFPGFKTFQEIYDQIEEYTSFDTDFGNFPKYPNFKLQAVNVLKEECAFDIFWPRCGRWITNLDLHDCIFYDEEKLRSLLSCQLTPYLQSLSIRFKFPNQVSTDAVPKLKAGKVNLSLTRFSISFKGHQLPFQWLDILSHYPNIKILRAQIELHSKKNLVLSLLSAIKQLREKDKSKWSLGRLTVRAMSTQMNTENWFSSAVDLLRTAELPLKCLNLRLDGDTTEDLFREFISIHEKTLKSLSLQGWYFPRLPGSAFPWNESLQEVRLERQVFTSLSFLRFLPNLKSLWIDGGSNPNQLVDLADLEDQGMMGIVRESVKSLTIRSDNIQGTCSVASLIKIFTWMPSVEKVEMKFTKESFSWICKHFTKLKHLCLMSGQTEVDNYCIAENIANLTELQSFKMQELPGFITPVVTIKSIIEGFLLLPHLQNLVIYADPDLDLNHASVIALKKKIPRVEIKFSRDLVGEVAATRRFYNPTQINFTELFMMS